jgi:hypothetical protein
MKRRVHSFGRLAEQATLPAASPSWLCTAALSIADTAPEPMLRLVEQTFFILNSNLSTRQADKKVHVPNVLFKSLARDFEALHARATQVHCELIP